MKTSNETTAEKKLSRKELMRVFWRSFTINASYQYERQMNQGFAYSLAPVINKLYDKKEDRVAAYTRHNEFFNVTPMVSPFVMGITAAMEEGERQ